MPTGPLPGGEEAAPLSLPGRGAGGEGRALGCAVYRRTDFAVGSLPEPDEAEFDDLVGPAERFASVADAGGRPLFPRRSRRPCATWPCPTASPCSTKATRATSRRWSRKPSG